MMHFTPFSVAALSYLFMLVAYFRPKVRAFHMPVMAASILFDISMPFYLVTHRHWWHRLVEQGDLFSFLAWMHFGLIITTYALEAAQVYSAVRILKEQPGARATHHMQGRALLMARGLVIVTGGFWA
ncbi:MAG: hypothetical protein KGI47_06010 [Betaproteobacteria bacterium]|nr:hypothetical protein [Betaproteobacteria bacterium]MDE2622500.1 hypothetical protein [Betaproteobacteria bacterium]